MITLQKQLDNKLWWIDEGDVELSSYATEANKKHLPLLGALRGSSAGNGFSLVCEV